MRARTNGVYLCETNLHSRSSPTIFPRCVIHAPILPEPVNNFQSDEDHAVDPYTTQDNQAEFPDSEPDTK